MICAETGQECERTAMRKTRTSGSENELKQRNGGNGEKESIDNQK